MVSWPSEERLSPVEAQLSGLRATVVIDARGEPSLLVTGASLDGTPVLFPRSLS
jgi:hypothetical protein